jgi:hypothetical protein
MLPAVQGDYGLLPASDTPHRATLEEVFELFVLGAPYAERRKQLWEVFPAYVRNVKAYFPTCRILLDGGFTTHKHWEAPDDIDVSIGVDPVQYNALQDWERAQVFNSVSATGSKVRVMGGMIDASRFHLANPDRWAKWHDDWSSVRAPDRSIVDGLKKGYVEVMA